MTHYTIPIFKTFSARWQCTVELSNVVYGLYISWNTRAGGWFLSISDVNGITLLSGVRMQPSSKFIERYRASVPGIPTGVLWLADIENNPMTAELTFDNFGERFLLMYSLED